jgi:hypothetical protein
MAYLPTSSSRLLLSDADFGSYAVIDTLSRTIHPQSFNEVSLLFVVGVEHVRLALLPSNAVVSYNLNPQGLSTYHLEATNGVADEERLAYAMTDEESSKLKFWSEMHSDSLNLPSKRPSSFAVVSPDIVRQFEPGLASNGLFLLIEDNAVGVATRLLKVASSPQGLVNVIQQTDLSIFEERVSAIKVDPLDYRAFVCSDRNACIFSLLDLSHIWELRTGLSAMSATSATTDLCLIGGGFIPTESTVTVNKSCHPKLAVGFGSKNVDFRFHKQIHIFDTYADSHGKSEVLQIPKGCDFSHLETCPLFPFLLTQT